MYSDIFVPDCKQMQYIGCRNCQTLSRRQYRIIAGNTHEKQYPEGFYTFRVHTPAFTPLKWRTLAPEHFIVLYQISVFLCLVKKQVSKYTEYECAGDGGNRYLTEVDYKSSDPGYKYD